MPTATDMRVTKGKCQFAFHSEFYPHIHILRNPQIDLSYVTNQALVLEVWSPGNNNSKINNVFDPTRKSTERSSVVFEKSLGVISDRHWRRQWHPTPVPLPGKSHGRRSLVGCSPWGRKEPNTTSLSLSLFTFTHWRRKWQPTPVFLPGESQGRRSLVGCRLWGGTELDTTEVT